MLYCTTFENFVAALAQSFRKAKLAYSFRSSCGQAAKKSILKRCVVKKETTYTKHFFSMAFCKATSVEQWINSKCLRTLRSGCMRSNLILSEKWSGKGFILDEILAAN